MKTKAVFKSFLPFIVFFAIQLVVAAAVSAALSVMFTVAHPELVADPIALAEGATEFYLSKITYVLVVIHALNVLIMALWIRKYNRLVPDAPAKSVLTVKNVVMIVLAGLGIQGFVIAILTGVTMVAPGALDNYSDMMQTAGIGQLTVASFLATVILAPIGEELCFRGVTSKILRHGQLPLWVVLVLPSILFGVMHMNPVQSTYATFMGLALAYVAYKYKSLWMSILLHLVINLSATVLNGFGFEFESDVVGMLVYGGCGIVLLLVAYFCFDKKNEEVVLAVEEAETVETVEESVEA